MKRPTVNTARLLAAALAMAPASAGAVAFDMPAPIAAEAGESSPMTSYALPVGPFAGTALPTRRSEGVVAKTAFRLDAPGMTTLQMLSPLRDQLRRDGFEVVFECESFECGGFDFRFGTDVLPEPDMHVDLGDFRFLAAENKRAGAVVSLLISRSAQSGFVHVVQVTPAENAAGVVASTKSPLQADRPETDSPLTASLAGGEPVVLGDLVFASGARNLTAGDYPSLNGLAAYMRDNPDAMITLTGHTDASGGKDANHSLSRARAESVRAALVGLGLSGDRIAAAGNGPDAPIASNDTAEGRKKNRRVEVTLTPTRVAP